MWILLPALLLPFLAALLRLWVILPPRIKFKPGPRGKTREKANSSCKVMAVLGSGGHTAELLQMMALVTPQFAPRHYVVAMTDTMSASKASAFEEARQQRVQFKISTIPRSREVGQSWVSSFFSTVKATGACFRIVLSDIPDVILCNGPGTCIPICIVGYLARFLGLRHVKVIFVESFARVEHLSLTGKILYYFADRFLVQWPELKAQYPEAEHLGLLI